MTPFKPFSYLCRWLLNAKLVTTAEQRLENLVLGQIVLIVLAGASVFTLCFLSLLGYIDLCIFAIGCAFFMGLLIAFCWSLTFLYEIQRQARMFGPVGLWIYRVICTALFFAFSYSPLLPPPRFLA